MESGRHNRPSAHFSKCENSALDLLAALLYFLGNVDWIFRVSSIYKNQECESKILECKRWCLLAKFERKLYLDWMVYLLKAFVFYGFRFLRFSTLTRFYRFQFFQSKLMRKTSEKVYHIAITADWFADKTRFTNQQALFYMDECARSDCP